MSNRQIGTTVLVIAMIIVAISVLFTNNLARTLQDEEKKNMSIWADATRQLILADNDADIDFVSSIIEKNTTIPVYICDENGNVIASRNADEKKLSIVNYQLSTDKHHGPIELKIDESTTQYIYWDDSSLLTKLRYVPYAQFALILIFITISVFVMTTAQRSEQNHLWVGLSKETAHQLGTPISSLNAWQQLLADQYPNDEYVPQMKRDIDRLQMIADRFQKIGSEPALQAENIIPVLQNAVAYMRARISNRVTIDDSCLSNVERVVMLNAPLLQWVVENLLKNAVDAISGNGSIVFQLHENEHDVMIDIADTGKGIDAKTQRRIFEPGFTSKERGWGLGLPLAKRIVEQYHGGKLLLKSSQTGVGTTFRIVLKKPENG
ncbi:MAG: HAMP domain-containing histidine kinase [Paludibacteraceae bacterium]|nr:HAMP domain-containing histidine kinase [Paludibacteraceae bacterium]